MLNNKPLSLKLSFVSFWGPSSPDLYWSLPVDPTRGLPSPDPS